jgi:Flp pilus assembly protein TadG
MDQTGLTTRTILNFWSRRGGASAVEFALTAPVLLAMSLGMLNLCAVLYANTSLRYEAEDAARCMSVKTLVCTNATTTQAYAAQHYPGPNLTNLTFTPTSGTCGAGGAPGNVITASGRFTLTAIIVNTNITLSASACYPS